MGYYVDIEDCEIFICKDDFDKAWEALVNLNTDPKYDILKHGGSSTIELSNGETVSWDSPRPEGYDYHPAKWFSWLEADFHKRHKNFIDFMKNLQMEPYFDDEGNIVSFSYNDKTGGEDVLFSALAPFIRNNSFIEWRGEDGMHWRWVFIDGKMHFAEPKISWVLQKDVKWDPDAFLEYAKTLNYKTQKITPKFE